MGFTVYLDERTTATYRPDLRPGVRVVSGFATRYDVGKWLTEMGYAAHQRHTIVAMGGPVPGWARAKEASAL